MAVPPSSRDQDPSSSNSADESGSDRESNSAESIDEPEVPGTVFLTLVLLMLIFGFWAMMYVILIDL